MQVTVVATIQAKPGSVEVVKEALLGLIPSTTQEEGCINYDLHQSTSDPTLFLFHENWRSQADLDQHLAMPYIQEMIRRTADHLARPIDIQLLSRIG